MIISMLPSHTELQIWRDLTIILAIGSNLFKGEQWQSFHTVIYIRLVHFVILAPRYDLAI